VLNGSTLGWLAEPVDLLVSGKVVGRMSERKPGEISIDLAGLNLDETQKTELLCRLEDVLKEILK